MPTHNIDRRFTGVDARCAQVRGICNGVGTLGRPMGQVDGALCANVGESGSAMAGESQTARPLTSTPQEMESQDLLRFCPLCFSHILRRPVALHSTPYGKPKTVCLACEECAVRWKNLSLCMKGMHPLLCPQCDALIAPAEVAAPFSNGGDANVVVNCATNSAGRIYADLTGGATTGSLCGICEEMGATNYCVACGFPLCESCQVSSHQRGQYRVHEVVPLCAARQRMLRLCREHPPRSLELYCFTCSVCVCITCCFDGVHKGHMVEPLEGVTRKMRYEMEEDAKQLQQLGTRARVVVEDSEKVLPAYERGIALVQDEIKQCFDILREALKQREEHLQRELVSYASRVKGNISRHASQCSVVQGTVQYMVSSVEKFFATTEAADIARLKNVMKTSMDTLTRTSMQVLDESAETCRVIDARLTCPGFVASFAAPTKEECMKHISCLGSVELPDTSGSVALPSNACEALATHTPVTSIQAPVAQPGTEWGDVSERQKLIPLLTSGSVSHEMCSRNDSMDETDRCQQLKLDWDYPQRKDESARATLPSLMVTSTAPWPTRAAAAATAAAIEAPSYKLAEKRPLSIDAEDEGEVAVPPYKQPKKATECLSGLILSNRSTRQDSVAASSSVLAGGALSAAAPANPVKTVSKEPGVVGTSSYLQLHF